MTTRPSLTEDQFVDMAFITSLLQMTDKWIYKLIKDGVFPKPIKLGQKLPMVKKRSRKLATGKNRPVP